MDRARALALLHAHHGGGHDGVRHTHLLISHGAQTTGHNAHLLPPAGHQDTTHSDLTHTDQCE